MNKTMHAFAIAAIAAIVFMIGVPYTGAQATTLRHPTSSSSTARL